MDAEFDKYVEEYRFHHAENIEASGEDPSYFAEYKIKELARRRPYADTMRILDFGSGVGGSTLYFKQYFPGAEITCLDISKRSLEFAQREYGEVAEYLHYDGEIIPCSDGAVDIGFAACVFHHIPPARHVDALRELKRVIKPGGAFFLFEHNPFNPLTVRAVNTCPFDENAVLVNAGRMKERLKIAGFKDIRTSYCVFFPRFLSWLRPLERRMAWLPLGAQYYLHAEC